MAFAAGTATGLTLGFGTTTTYDAIQVTTLSFDGITAEAIDVSHLGTTGYKDYISSELKDGGSLTVEGVLDPNVPMLPVNVSETITVTENIVDSAHGTAGTAVFSGFVTSFSSTRGIDEAMRFSATIKVAGDITFTASNT